MKPVEQLNCCTAGSSYMFSNSNIINQSNLSSSPSCIKRGDATAVAERAGMEEDASGIVTNGGKKERGESDSHSRKNKYNRGEFDHS